MCDTPDLCFEHDDSVARCGPCAAKLAERDGVTLTQYTVSNPEAMRLRRELDRAEAALAAQIEADAGLLQDVADNWDCGCDSRYCRCAELAEQWSFAADEIRAQPHDRSALDRMLAEAREKVLREEAAGK